MSQHPYPQECADRVARTPRTSRHRRRPLRHGRRDRRAGRQARQSPADQAGHDAQPSHREDPPHIMIGQPERATQNRVIALFRDELHYRYLGDWTHREGNSNIEEGIVTAYLSKAGYNPPRSSKASNDFRTKANNNTREATRISKEGTATESLSKWGYNPHRSAKQSTISALKPTTTAGGSTGTTK